MTFSVYLPLMMEATGKMMLQGTLTSNTRHVVVDEKFPALCSTKIIEQIWNSIAAS